ncbi:hypothetical protein Hypma_010745 [Hypsizygus marmoreus]|uniref:Uncharacterized protein n=1 Tax=Hypsizygus marmoreus TaxID=39966 RepID=A0A369JLL6_HYPMA|nr:hypothetical protein Hypma_010745 [Hypsizygus marmoreus]
MYTTFRAKPKRPDLPELPPEIWLDIFRFATWPPLDLDPGMTLQFLPTEGRERRQLLKQSLVTRRYLVRVCKRWHSMAASFLYESLLIGRGRGLQTVRDVLKASRVPFQQDAPSDENDRPVGWWTKRLDFAMRDVDRLDFDVDVCLTLLSEIVECLPNLAILTFCVTAPQLRDVKLPPSFLQTLVRVSGHSLHTIQWNSLALVPSRCDWVAFIKEAVNIKAVRRPRFFAKETDPREQLSSSSLEILLLPRTPEDPSDFEQANLPSLRHVVLNALLLQDSRWRFFLEEYGPKLEVVQLIINHKRLTAFANSKLTSHCPRLVRLDISFSSWELLMFETQPIAIPPTVQRLGIQSTRKEATAKGYRALFHGIQTMEIMSLKTIQFLDIGNVRDLCQRHPLVLSKGLHMIRTRGLQLLDHEGLAMK